MRIERPSRQLQWRQFKELAWCSSLSSLLSVEYIHTCNVGESLQGQETVLMPRQGNA